MSAGAGQIPDPGSGWTRIRRLIAPALIIAFAVVAVWLVDPFGEKATLGRIVVDTPEIYTRERLVNDRFLQDAWLSRELEHESINPSHQTVSEHRGAALRAGGAGDSASAPAAGDRAKAATEGPNSEVRLSSRALLLEKVDYRDVVRNLAIENQLDDRHDLNGNSLYKLKFDVAVLPGTNTQASAQVSVRLLEPSFLTASRRETALRSLTGLGSEKEIEEWKKIYLKWIENLGSRLNQTQRELKQAYFSNEFSHNDYARLTAFLSSSLKIAPQMTGACPAPMIELHGHERNPLRLSTQDHIERKTCVRALVEKTILWTLYGSPDPSSTKVGAYEKSPSIVARPTTGSDQKRLTVVNDLLEYWLNSYFAAKTVKLVLGVAVPESSFIHGFHFAEIPVFQNLAQLTFFNPNPLSSEKDVFTVKPRVAAIAAIDATKVREEELNAIYDGSKDYWIELSESTRTYQTKHEHFAANLLPNMRLHVSSINLKNLQKDDVELSEHDFKDISNGKGVYVARAEVGLLNFARMARRNMRAFTYSVTPKESSDTVSFTLSTDSQVEGSTPSAGEVGAGALQMRREALSRTLERRNAVVGFSNFTGDESVKTGDDGAKTGDDGAKTGDDSAQFGWLIAPRHTAIDGQRHVQVQTPGQYPLSALVSLPSWWNQARLEVTTSWVGKAGKVLDGTTKSALHVIDIPIDFEPLEAILLGIEQLGPELMESRLDPVLLTACSAGDIVIPGRRLWRSTRVTLGYQAANSIVVLPNMKGIIARFTEVKNQVSVTEAEQRPKGGPLEITRSVRVWTSQGSLTLPSPARIGIPLGPCPAQK